MSINTDLPKISFAKATAMARVLTNQKVRVSQGQVEGPCTDGKGNIYLGPAVEWDTVDRYAVIVHECCHNIFPAKYPAGNIRKAANAIDDCRIERQFTNGRPHYTNALEVLAVNVIANGKYDPRGENAAWDKANFDPGLWVTLFFRSFLDREIRLAATEAVLAYAAEKGYDKDAAWRPKFDKLVDDGLRITRLKSVSCETLTKFCTDYFEVFPDANRDLNQSVAVAVFGDAGSGSDSADSDGSGSEEEDSEIAGKAKGEGEGKAKGQPPKQEEAPDADDLDGAIEKLKEQMGKVRDDKQQKAEQQHGPDADGLDESKEEKEGDEEKDGKGKERDKEDKYDRWLPPGRGDRETPNSRRQHPVDRNVVNRIKMSVRKLQHLAMDRVEQNVKSGRLNFPALIRANALGLVATKPFIAAQDDKVFRPVACCVATDFSGSTDGAMNGRLNETMHNLLYSLQGAGCECTGVVWNSGATIVKRIDDQVSAVETKWHGSDGGTELMAAAAGSIRSLKPAKATRKIAFIFTDGQVNTSELEPVQAELKQNGFGAALLVSLGCDVPRKGIIQTATIKDLSELVGVFERFVRAQVARAVDLA